MALRSSDWRAALAAEVREQSIPVWGVLARAVMGDDDLCTLTFHQGRLRRGQDSGTQVRLDEDLERARIEQAAPRDTPSAWSGSVQVVLRDSSELVVRLNSPRRPPSATDTFRIWPHNYLEQLSEWLQGHSLPEDLDELLAARCRRPRLPPPSWTGPSLLRRRQREAFALAGHPTSILWGPPGTGKTFTLAQLTAALVREGKRVLVLAPTRVATDTVALAIDTALDAAGVVRQDSDVLRTDLPELYAAFSQRGPRLMAWALADAQWQRTAASYHRERASLLASRQRADDAARSELDQQLGELRTLHEEARRRYKEHQDGLVSGAKVVCATLRQNQARLWHAGFDQVLVDEASMVSVSDAMHLLVTSSTPILFAGDHKQLGPISVAAGRGREGKVGTPASEAARHWLGQSILEFLDSHLVRLGLRRVMLDEQSRMNAELCAVVSAQMYDGKLRAIDAPEAGLRPLLPAGICLMDSDAPPRWLRPWDQLGRPTDPYTATERSAAVAVGLARELAGRGHTVVLAAPYRSQASLLRRGTGDLQTLVRAGTVHRLQGQEADVAIYDPTKPHQYWPDKSREAPLMVNVAASRAKRAFVLCNGRRWLEQSELLRGYLVAGTWLSDA